MVLLQMLGPGIRGAPGVAALLRVRTELLREQEPVVSLATVAEKKLSHPAAMKVLVQQVCQFDQYLGYRATSNSQGVLQTYM